MIPGSKSAEHMRENAAAGDAPELTAEELRQVAEVRDQR